MSLITCKNRRGGTLSFLLAVLFAVATSAALPALADVVVDLNGETISADKTAFSTYKDKILQNGTINLSNSPSDTPFDVLTFRISREGGVSRVDFTEV